MTTSDIGPSAAPNSTFVRRARLQRLGCPNPATNEPSPSEEEPHMSETTPLKINSAAYGSIPRSLLKGTSLNCSPWRSTLELPPRTATSSPSSGMLTPPVLNLSQSAFSGINTQRPISAYDAPLDAKVNGEQGLSMDARKNGVRVWYSSYSSIDWMHDAIKESLRFSRLRKRNSLKAHIHLAFDRLLGWLIVTVIGFLSAVVAFCVTKSEQWLFDLKYGYCTAGWPKSKRFCCPEPELFPMTSTEIQCQAWRQWSDVFTWKNGFNGEFLAYTCIAIFLAVCSCWLNIVFTKSTSFVTRKESGVLGPAFKDSGAPAIPPKVSYYASGSGIPELKAILSGFVIHGYLGGRVLIAKSVGLALSVASGLQLGKEGPLVHIACCIGNIISRLASKYETNEAKRREILSAACAAGVAVAFGAPIGGTLFSLEEVSYFFPAKVMWRSFFCAMVAAISLKLLNPFGTGKLVLFQVTYDKDWHAYELFPFVLLGVFGGVYGAYFNKLNWRWSRDVRNATWLKNHPVIEVLLVTLATCVFCFLNPYTRMGGTELVSALFSECKKGVEDESGLCLSDPGSWAQVTPILGALSLALLVRGALTVVTFGLRLPAGIFIPSLVAGAIAGRITGTLLQYTRYHYPDSQFFSGCNGDLDCIIPGLYAMVGAAASLAGVTRTTVSLAVIMFELTDTLSYTIPVMVAVLCAKTTADALEEKGIYEIVINVARLPYLDSRKTFLWGDRQLTDVIVRDVQVIRLDKANTVTSLCDDLKNLLHGNGNNDDVGIPILRSVDEDGELTRLVGVIGARELEHALCFVADHPDERISFETTYSHHPLASASFSSLLDDHDLRIDIFDFSIYMDQAPLTVNLNSPLELVQQCFVKLGARYIVVTDMDGHYEGIIDKKTWMAFLNESGEQ